MLSSGDECKTFGDQADGFVDGEGVGAIVLKPLPKAIADGDHIYGIIKGSMLNAGGKTNGYTVPNPNAQAQLIEEALKQAGINPRTISYIEAHGTGTSLGDPIEIAGLTKAFAEYTKDQQYCAIGSAKSNIGHCESASGIAGVAKVLLQMKHRQLVPSLHSEVLNPNIDFSKTPFIVQQELAEWKRPVLEINGEKKEYPRIAGVSSFGAGGSNAHVIIEEYIPLEHEKPPITITPQNPAIIVLSAQNEERLKEQAQQLLTAIRGEQYTDTDLADMAYTLQVGREAMEERLGMKVGSIQELEEKLQGFIDDRDNIEELYRGQLKRNQEALAVLATDEEMQETIDKWIKRGKYSKLVDLWVKGLNFDWNKLHPEAKPRRISLPTYPFAKKRCWVAKSNAISYDNGIQGSKDDLSRHSLLQQNISNTSGEYFNYQQEAQIIPELFINNISEKPAGMSLQPLSHNRIISNNTPDQTHHFNKTFNIQNAKTAYSQSTINDKTLQNELTKSLAEALYMESGDISLDSKFIDIGLDSVIGMEWINVINKQYGTSIKATNIYDYPCIREFAELVKREILMYKEASESLTERKGEEIHEIGSLKLPTTDTLQPESDLSNATEKPKGIALPGLSHNRSLFHDLLSQKQPQDESPATNISINPEMKEISKRVFQYHDDVSEELLQKELKTSLAEALYMESADINIDSKFIDIGLDSVIGMEWINVINKQYETSIKATNIYDYPNIREFAGFVKREIVMHKEVSESVSERKGEEIHEKGSLKNKIKIESRDPAIEEQREEIQATNRRQYSQFAQRTELTSELIVDSVSKAGNPALQSISTTLESGKQHTKIWVNFPELIKMNQVVNGRPIFWFHPGNGGVESCEELAQQFQRPFYGIQSQRWMTDRTPLQSFQAMAAYYVNILRSVQPEGPYDLGGYSTGGAIAYEVTRQLQELGQRVATIVMIDSLDGNSVKKFRTEEKSSIIHIVNNAILLAMKHDPEQLAKAMIHRDEVNLELDSEEYFKLLIKLAKERGVKKSESLLHATFQKSTAIEKAYNEFTVLPLTDPNSLTCYYFRNKSGLFLGEYDPYYSTVPDFAALVDHSRYWEEWEQQIPDFCSIDVESSSHIAVFSQPESYAVISAFCGKLYSEKAFPKEYLRAFIKELLATQNS